MNTSCYIDHNSFRRTITHLGVRKKQISTEKNIWRQRNKSSRAIQTGGKKNAKWTIRFSLREVGSYQHCHRTPDSLPLELSAQNILDLFGNANCYQPFLTLLQNPYFKANTKHSSYNNSNLPPRKTYSGSWIDTHLFSFVLIALRT